MAKSLGVIFYKALVGDVLNTYVEDSLKPKHIW